jgi:hypothetical protein
MTRLKVIKNQRSYRLEKEVAANKRKIANIKKTSILRDTDQVHHQLRGVRVETVDGTVEAGVVVVNND